MFATIIAVTGTLLGAIIAGWFQNQSAGRTERVARHEKLATDCREAVTQLCVAICDHRSMMYQRADAALRGLPAARIQELRSASHETRSAVTRPLVTMRLLIQDPQVRAAADAMVTATYAMRDAEDTRENITDARLTAVEAHDRFVDVASTYLLTNA